MFCLLTIDGSILSLLRNRPDQVQAMQQIPIGSFDSATGARLACCVGSVGGGQSAHSSIFNTSHRRNTFEKSKLLRGVLLVH